jgi:phenylacetate-CoA ligase
MSLLRKTVRHAVKNCSFYKKTYGEFNPAILQTRNDIETLPLINSDDIRQDSHKMLCVSQSRVARVVTMHTSGSTGNPKRLFFTERDLKATTDFFYAGMQSLISQGDRVLVLLPWEQPASVGDLLIRTLQQNGSFAEGMWPPDLSGKGSNYIQAKKLNCVVGLPQHLLTLSYSLNKGSVHSMLLCSDYAAPALRKQIETNCGCETFLHYGSTETGLGGGVECSFHNGCHLRDSDLLFEIIDPLTGKQKPDNTPGELVVTTLNREAMPLIRYRTGDHAALIHETCNCGGITTRLTTLKGRIDACQLSGGGLLCSNELDDILYTQPGLVDYRAHLDSSGQGDTIHVFYTALSCNSVPKEKIRSLLLLHPVLSEAFTKNELQIGIIRWVETFDVNHTLKRTINDTRNLGKSDAIYT